MNTIRCGVDKGHVFSTTYEATKEDATRAFGEWHSFLRVYLDGHSISTKHWKHPIMYVNDAAWMIVEANGNLKEPTQQQMDDIKQCHILFNVSPNNLASLEKIVDVCKKGNVPQFTTD